MKVVILAGGVGSRLQEETSTVPKPLVTIDGKPILWHIMKIYSHYGYNEFIICCGYKGYLIKEYFHNYYLHNSDITINLENNGIYYHKCSDEKWKVTLLDTGLETLTAGRIKQVQPYINNEPFFLTYGDGVADINLDELLKCHKQNKTMITLTAVQSVGKFGLVEITKNNIVKKFKEKPLENDSWINGGFFVVEPDIFQYITKDDFSKNLELLAKMKKVSAYKHAGFWKAMDTLHDKQALETLVLLKKAEWIKW